jgi:hypothetical protein
VETIYCYCFDAENENSIVLVPAFDGVKQLLRFAHFIENGNNICFPPYIASKLY